MKDFKPKPGDSVWFLIEDKEKYSMRTGKYGGMVTGNEKLRWVTLIVEGIECKFWINKYFFGSSEEDLMLRIFSHIGKEALCL